MYPYVYRYTHTNKHTCCSEYSDVAKNAIENSGRAYLKITIMQSACE